MSNNDFLIHDFLIPQSYSALPEYMKPKIESLNESNSMLDKEKWVTIPVGSFIVAPDVLAKFGS
jgi:hypothetical protein